MIAVNQKSKMMANTMYTTALKATAGSPAKEPAASSRKFATTKTNVNQANKLNYSHVDI